MRKLEDGGLLREAVERLGSLDRVEVEDVEFELPAGGGRADAVVHARIAGSAITLLIESKAYGYPRDARAALLQARQHADDLDLEDAAVMIVALSLTEESRRYLRNEGAGYWDRSGSLYLDVPGALYDIERPRSRGVTRPTSRAFEGSAAQVLHALLLQPDHAWTVTGLADVADVSPATVHRVFRFLEQHEWMESEGNNPRIVRRLIEPGRLLDEWAAQYSLRRYKVAGYYSWARSAEHLRTRIMRAFEGRATECALTASAGAQLVAPYATAPDAAVFLAPAVQGERVMDQEGIERTDSGSNITLLLTAERSPLMFRQDVKSYQVASNVQLYLDLWVWPERGREQARHLRQERLGY